jgi:hypothetical protein
MPNNNSLEFRQVDSVLEVSLNKMNLHGSMRNASDNGQNIYIIDQHERTFVAIENNKNHQQNVILVSHASVESVHRGTTEYVLIAYHKSKINFQNTLDFFENNLV